MATTPTVNKLLLGQELRHLIEDVAKISQAEAGALIEVGQSRIGNVINAVGTLSYAELSMLITKLGVTDQDYLDWLLELRRDSGKRGFWTTGHFRAIHEDFRRWVSVEQRADLLRFVGSEVIPDILQTEPYIRALFSDRTEDYDATHDDFVQVRLSRQKVLDTNTECQIVMSESSLHAELGGTEVMRGQITHLVELSRRPNVQIQIIPFKVRTPGGRAVCFPFQLARVPSRGLAGPLEMAFFRSPGELRYIDDKEALATYQRTWDRLTAVALSPDQTRHFLKHIANSPYT